MSTPKVTPQDRPMTVVEHDTFVDDIAVKVVRPSPRSRGFVDLPNGARKRSIGPAS